MSILNVRNLAYIRNIPVFGSRLYEALQDIQQGVGAVVQQGNLNPNGQPEAPPPLQSITATGQNGVLHVSLENSSAGLRRGHINYIEHADNASFNNAQIRNIGDSRSFTEFIGNQERFVRGYNAYPGSAASAHVYHGGEANPQPVSGGGTIGPPAYLPSQGAGTGAAGQGGMGPGPDPVRTESSGFDWRLQRAQGLSGGFTGTGSPGSQGSAGTGGGSGGGGGVSTQSIIVGTHSQRLANFPSVKYPVNAEFYESDRTSFYWAQNASGTVTVTTGTTVTWNTGNHFINTGSGFTAVQWPAGTQIIINGVTCHVAAVSSSTVLTLQAATANAGPVSYLVPSGRWVYLEGEYAAALASMPTDLGENDTILVSSKVALGFLFYENAVFAHQVQWNVSAWQRGPHDEEHADTFHECGHVIADLGWYPCDGTSTTYFDYATPGTPVARTVPGTNATPAFYKGGPSYSATLNAPAAPTFTGSFTGTADPGVAVLAGLGAPSQVVGAPYTPLGSVAGTISLPSDPVENVAVIKMYRR